MLNLKVTSTIKSYEKIQRVRKKWKVTQTFKVLKKRNSYKRLTFTVK
jgi:hypothetical protein